MSRRRRQEHIPEERYDIDGTLIKNEAAFKAKSWNLSNILRDPVARSRAIKEAQEYIKANRGKLELEKRTWSEETDEIFFSRKRKGLAAWMMPRGSPIYFEFEAFYLKLKESLQADNPSSLSSSSKKYEMLRREGELLRHALILFQDFQRKKTAQLKEKLAAYKAELPITAYSNAILRTLAEHRVLLVAGDTGCGKSTQVPQILMQAGYHKIACTQPRRIACSSLARRVSYETLNEFGSQIAYQVRFEGTQTKRTRILFLTEGLLLRQYAMDPLLSMYDVIIVDEVHERHMMGDFLLALLKRLLAVRQDLHVVLMSATINAELFAQYFDAPTLNVPGRMYTVKTHYWKEGQDDKNLVNDAAYHRRQTATVKESVPSRSERIDAGPYLKVLEYIDQSVPVAERGDLLIFMSGINEISTLADELKQYGEHSKNWIILMLHSTLAVDEQDKVFDTPPEGVRKCIISSNIAETSLTIDGIRFVIDSGKVKELSHDANSNMSKLSEFWISKASATQRAGRSGRTGPGECFRLYSQNEFEHFNDFAVPEIQRAPLEPLLLQIKAFELGDPRVFDYVEAPSIDAVNASMNFLQNLGAVDSTERILGLGTVLANLPVDAIIGKMLLMATVFNLVDPIITIAASMSVQSPFTRLSPDVHSDILRNRRKLDSEHGDPITLVNLWQQWLNAKSDRKTSSRNWCRRHGIEEHRLYEIAKMRRQFEKVLNDFQPGLLQHLKEQENSEEEREQRSRKRDQLKREKYEERSSKRRRILTMEYEEQEDWQAEGHNTSDIRDLEFTMANNVKNLMSRAATLSKRDINLIKLIICSALYPQLAIGDEHNPYRKSNEIVFHTPVKKFISIHPTSVISAHPDWVQGIGDNVRKDDLAVEQSMQHQLLCYLQLLETNKPYLLGLTRVPGIHTLLLFSKTIDTNADCSVLVFDTYYMAKFRTTAVAEHVLYLAYKLRETWLYLLNRRISRGLGEQVPESDIEEIIITPSAREDMPKTIKKIIVEQEKSKCKGKSKVDMWTPAVESAFQAQVDSLADQLAIAMETAISADFRVAKPSELINMYPKYTKPTEKTESNLPRAWNSRDVIREGIRITPNLYYNTLDAPSCASSVPVEEEAIPANIKMYWHCPHCDSTFSFTHNDILNHLPNCHSPS
ncbi:P-loop containing nucleoside triphosphate hydrolase protein [Zychaea mexicana]|uniref:P-loop containing nucleoside triphosphate hydrolase protein n=1 Tax=Zychaea mexicana TaxID=64656 RepID=UPI0022FEB6B3|nr:P-loop containing nucleoside triphosphate hydrolase protein [Zychaea mexicana]KAI9491621.1 P-loop containing nucleoside triphosphate hydrolase protein [Zychaea mexicana]